MGGAEDILYQAYNEGIRDEVFAESKKLRETDPRKWKHKEYCDILEEAYKIVKERKDKNNENI